MRLFKFASVLLIFFLYNLKPANAQSENPWPMLGSNPQRTSHSLNEVPGDLKPLWIQPIRDFLLPDTQPVIAENKIFISTSRGLAAFHVNDQGPGIRQDQGLWYFATQMPLGNSPTYQNGYLYVGGLDRNLYKINASNGSLVWKFTATAGFVTNPLVFNNTVYLGNRDGYFYAVKDNGSSAAVLWKFDTQNSSAPRAQINHSAAYSADSNRIFFGAMNGYAYAVDAGSGNLAWKKQLSSMGFSQYWPVVYNSGSNQKIIFTTVGFNRTGSQAEMDFPGIVGMMDQKIWLGIDIPTSVTYSLCPNYPLKKQLAGEVTCPAGQTPTVDVSKNPIKPGNTIINFIEQHPQTRSTYILNQSDGNDNLFNLDGDTILDPVPFLLSAPEHQTNYPPLITPDGTIWARNPIMESGTFSGSLPLGWIYGTGSFKLGVSSQPGLSADWEHDEMFAYSSGGNYLYWNRAADGNAGGANLALANTNFPDTTPNRQWRYITGNSQQDGINSYKESRKFFAEPGKLETDGMLQYAADHQSGPVPYGDKVFLINSNTLFAFSAQGKPFSLWNANEIKPSTPPPASPQYLTASLSPAEMQIQLASEISKIVGKGHLKPAYFHTGLSDSHAVSSYQFQDLFDYWSNPADTILILTQALPHLAEPLKSQLKSYIKSEYSNFSPALYRHSGWTEGTFRQSFAFPGGIANSTVAKESTSIPPRNIYAIWKFVQAGLCDAGINCTKLGEFNKIQNKLSPTLPNINFTSYPHALNSYIAGYIGYIGLANEAGESISTQYSQVLNELKNMRLNGFSAYPSSDTSTLQAKYYHVYNSFINYLYLTPELADFLKNSTFYQNIIKPALDVNLDLAPYSIDNSPGPRGPYWMLAHNHTVNGENGVMPYQQTWALFQAKAILAKESRAELSKYLDSPVTPVGDLYYIHNLIAALNAGSNPSPPPISSSPSITFPPASLPGDANGDNKVDGLDYVIWLNNYNKPATGVSKGDFNNSGFVDGLDYVIWLNNYNK